MTPFVKKLVLEHFLEMDGFLSLVPQLENHLESLHFGSFAQAELVTQDLLRTMSCRDRLLLLVKQTFWARDLLGTLSNEGTVKTRTMDRLEFAGSGPIVIVSSFEGVLRRTKGMRFKWAMLIDDRL